jgi:hypothetical protein
VTARALSDEIIVLLGVVKIGASSHSCHARFAGRGPTRYDPAWLNKKRGASGAPRRIVTIFREISTYLPIALLITTSL